MGDILSPGATWRHLGFNPRLVVPDASGLATTDIEQFRNLGEGVSTLIEQFANLANIVPRQLLAIVTIGVAGVDRFRGVVHDRIVIVQVIEDFTRFLIEVNVISTTGP